jgi:flagellar motor switch/type III secretory pathway protein FliN
VERERFAWVEDVQLTIEAVIPCRPIQVAEILALRPGAVISTPLAAGSNIDVFAGGARIGGGELSRTESRTIVRMAQFGSKR